FARSSFADGDLASTLPFWARGGLAEERPYLQLTYITFGQKIRQRVFAPCLIFFFFLIVL
ncbi:MAG: hypothetical protein ACOCNS_07845, partial [Bacteroidales bacterium]